MNTSASMTPLLEDKEVINWSFSTDFFNVATYHSADSSLTTVSTNEIVIPRSGAFDVTVIFDIEDNGMNIMSEIVCFKASLKDSFDACSTVIPVIVCNENNKKGEKIKWIT